MAKSEQAGLEGSALERPWTGRENPSMHGHRWVAPEGWVRVAEGGTSPITRSAFLIEEPGMRC